MVSEKFKILVGKVKKRISELKPEDIANFAIKEAAGSIPVIGQYITDAIEEFSPDEKLGLLIELKDISQNQFMELSKEIGVSVEYLKDIKTFTYDACAIQKADHEEIKGLLLRLIKSQTKFEIGQQKAEIIYNAAGDIIIYNSITNKPVTIPSIQSILRKKDIKEGEFFRTEPLWVDFEQGFIVERKEVNDIMKRLESNDVQLVLGAPASGKSVILKNVGYKLANDGKKNVHIVELKRHSIDEIKLFFETIPKIDDYNQIFIIDDAHLNLFYCERLAEEFKSEMKGNLIIGSRESREITEEHPKDGAEYEILSELSKTCIHVQAEDVTERVIETFLEKQYHILSHREKPFLQEYKRDLWLLSWALKAYNPKMDSVEDDVICRNITNSIEKIRVGKEKDPINAQDAFLPLSIFYRFEIPIERFFMEEQLQIDGKTINQLIGLQEIVETKESGHRMLSLHHSSIAELYFGAYLRESDLGRKIKKNILNGKDEKHLEYCSFFRYLTTSDPRNTIDVFLSLNRNFSVEKGGLTLLRKLLDHEEINKLIEIGINKQDDLEKIGGCVRGIAEGNGKVAFELIKSIDIDVLSAKIEKEKDIEKVGKCVKSVAEVNEARAMKLADSISARIEIEEDLIKVGRCFSDIARASKEVAMKLADSVSARVEKEDDIEKVGKLVNVIVTVWADEEAGLKLVDSISSKIETEPDIKKIGKCLKSIAEASKRVGFELTDLINIDTFSEKIEKEEDIREIGKCLMSIALVNRGVAKRLIDSIGVGVLSSKIEKEEDLWNIYSFVKNIAEINKDMLMGLDDSVSARIDKEADIEKITSVVSKLFQVNPKASFNFVKKINIKTILSKIDDEENIEKIGSFVSTISKANRKVGFNLVEEIGINTLSSKVDYEENIENIGIYIASIAYVNRKAGLKLVEGIDIDALSSKIKKEDDIEKFRKSILGFTVLKDTVLKEEVPIEIINYLIPKLREKLQKRIG